MLGYATQLYPKLLLDNYQIVPLQYLISSSFIYYLNN